MSVCIPSQMEFDLGKKGEKEERWTRCLNFGSTFCQLVDGQQKSGTREIRATMSLLVSHR